VLKKIIILMSIITFSFANYGTLRILVDYGQKENISLVDCSSATIEDFPFLNSDLNDTTSDSILTTYNPSSLFMCKPPTSLSNPTDNKFFEPTIIMFNDTGLKGIPSLINKKLLSSSSLNKLIYSYLTLSTGNHTKIEFNQTAFKELSKFNPKHFYFAITPDIYKKLYTGTGLTLIGTNFIKNYLNKAKDVLSVNLDPISKKTLENKVKLIKDLINLNIFLYKQLNGNFIVRLKDKKTISFAETGILSNISCPTNYSTCNTCLSSISYNINKDCTSVCSSFNVEKQCQNRINGLTNKNGLTVSQCMSYNCGNTNLPNNLLNPNASIPVFGWGGILYNIPPHPTGNLNSIKNKLSLLKIAKNKYINSLALNGNGKINNVQTLLKQNAICRKDLENNIAKTFKSYSEKLKSNIIISNSANLTYLYKSFNVITLDIHKILLTNNLNALLSNKDCIHGLSDSIMKSKINILDYVNRLKLIGSNFVTLSSKLLGKNLNAGYNEYNAAGTYPNKTNGNVLSGGTPQNQSGGTFQSSASKPLIISNNASNFIF